MLPTRALFTRPVLRHLFHSGIPRPQEDKVQDQDVPVDAKDGMNQLIHEVEQRPDTHRGAVASTIKTKAPHEIFEAWNADSFYAPLAFLRERRMREPKRTIYPSVGPSAADAAYTDAFTQLDIDPVSEANNGQLLQNFISSMGRIRPRSFTRLSWRSQRKVTQAIKRAKQKGVLPIHWRPKPSSSFLLVLRGPGNKKSNTSSTS